MSVLILSLPGMEPLSARLAAGVGARMGTLALHRFPDGECRVRIDPVVKDKVVVIVASLDRPDEKLLPLVFGAATGRELGAESVGLVAPYLAYMRQDRRFHGGEGISARYFAGILDHSVDWLVTVDPHLHRIRKLEDLFTIPTESVQAEPLMADWVRGHIERPMLIGPDSESMQWVGVLANLLGAPHAVLTKRRSDDRRVEIRLPDLSACVGHQPVLIDDIIASGGTMLESARLLQRAGWPPPACLAVHGVFAGGAYEALQDAGMTTIATCNTIPHPSNAIDVGGLVAAAVTQRLRLSGMSEPSLEAAR